MTKSTARMLLEVRNLQMRLRTEAGELRAIQDVSFEVRSGEVVALVGESGAGKSVTAMSVLRLIPTPPAVYAGGQILLEGHDLLRFTPSQMRDVRGSEVSMIFQEPMTALNPALRVWRQIAEPLVRHRGMNWGDAKLRAIELLKLVQIPDATERAEAYPHQFSGGMRQRVMIAMALSCEPKVIIADEPTTALDVTVQAQILSLLTKLTKESGGALVLVTHDLGVVARYADRVNVMYAGRIVESAPVDALFENPRHPYTRALLASIPRLEGDAIERLQSIAGQPPQLMSDPVGCEFADRCPEVLPRCRTDRPAHFKTGNGDASHLSACWLCAAEACS